MSGVGRRPWTALLLLGALCAGIVAWSVFAWLDSQPTDTPTPPGERPVKVRDLCAWIDQQGIDSRGPVDRRLCPEGWDR